MSGGTSAGLVRDLLLDQHPDLAGLPLREVDGGWGNQMWRLGDDLAVRVQRMDATPDHQLNERRWLPVLAPHLPLRVPGTPLDRGSIERPQHAAQSLAAFLRALHVTAPDDAPADPGRGAHPRDCTGGFEGFLRSVDAVVGDADAARAVWAEAVAAPAWDGAPVWVHGDLHPANVVVEDGTLTGVVDFGDLFVGDPALDLAAAWVLLPAGAARTFLTAYAPDPAAVRRARGHAVLTSLFLMLMGQNGDRGLPGGKPGWGPLGRAALDRVLADDLTGPLHVATGPT